MIAADIDGYWGEMEVDYHSALQDGIPSPPKDPANMGVKATCPRNMGQVVSVLQVYPNVGYTV